MTDQPNRIATEAMIRSVHTMTVRLALGNDTPELPLPKPFQKAPALKAIRTMLVNVLAKLAGEKNQDYVLLGARDHALERNPADPLTHGMGGVVGLKEAQVYEEALMRIGKSVMKPVEPGEVRPDQEALALRYVVFALMRAVPDDLVIDANRQATYWYLEIDPPSHDPKEYMRWLTLRTEIEFLKYFMDTTGVTDRFLAKVRANDA